MVSFMNAAGGRSIQSELLSARPGPHQDPRYSRNSCPHDVAEPDGIIDGASIPAACGDEC